ncbi:ATP-binding protein [Abditibacterium utsteinense]|uniref:ATP-binding protein n=1 Tax=Abditibacterium utsteinense TaxID=1960156 RepID=A0A2S8SU11_9BACT|nr:diphthine--ammonia ligase [Abditibacterium utsteinense]PQV64291.1 ATP-binding protein [Abditibacterium utsteinense]
MNNSKPIALAWSGGKDSTLALLALREAGIEVGVLLTTVTEDYNRISVHGVRRVLLEEQAAALGVPLEIALIAPRCSNDDYEASFGEALQKCRARGITRVAAGDLYLEDVRAYREKLFERHGVEPLFPLWGRDTAVVARDFIGAGFEAILSCVDTQALDKSFVGRAFDASLLSDLPATIDPCGENGEFHTFVWDGPLFARPISCERGEVVLRDERFAFCDLLQLE